MALASRSVPGAPWYRQFWPWFLIAMPALSVAGGIAALTIALRNADSLVRDDWYTHGLAINVDLARERVAADLGISATVSLSADARQVLVALADRAPLAVDALELELTHPTHADRDRTIRLVRDGDGLFRARLTVDPSGRWNASLTPPGAAWRLVGSVRLAPGIGGRLAPRS